MRAPSSSWAHPGSVSTWRCRSPSLSQFPAGLQGWPNRCGCRFPAHTGKLLRSPHRPGGHAGSNRQRSLPSRYGQVAESDVQPLGRPNIKVTRGVQPGPAIHRRGRHPPGVKSGPDALGGLSGSGRKLRTTSTPNYSVTCRLTLAAVDRPVAVGD